MNDNTSWGDTALTDHAFNQHITERLETQADGLQLPGLHTIDDIVTTSTRRDKRRRVSYRVATIAAVIALAFGIGGLLDTTQSTPTVTADESGSEQGAEPAVIAEAWPSGFPEIQSVTSTSLPATAAAPQRVVVVDDGFVSFDRGDLLTSQDGVTWNAVVSPDLDNAHIYDLDYADGLYAIAGSTAPPPPSDEAGALTGLTGFVATSSNLTDWTRLEIPSAELNAGSPWIVDSFPSGLTIGDKGVAALISSSISPNLAAFGLADTTLCGYSWGSDTIEYQICGEDTVSTVSVDDIGGLPAPDMMGLHHELWFVPHSDPTSVDKIELPDPPAGSASMAAEAMIETVPRDGSEELVLVLFGRMYRMIDGQGWELANDMPRTLWQMYSADGFETDGRLAIVGRSTGGTKVGVLSPPAQWTTTSLNDLLGQSVQFPVVSGSAKGWVVGGQLIGMIGSDPFGSALGSSFSINRGGYVVSGNYGATISLDDPSGDRVGTWSIIGLANGQLEPQAGLEVIVGDDITLVLSDPTSPQAAVTVTAVELFGATPQGSVAAEAESIVLFSPNGESWGELGVFPGQLAALTMSGNEIIAVTHIGPASTIHKIILE